MPEGSVEKAPFLPATLSLVLREDVEDRREGQKDQAKRILGNMKSNSRFASSQVLCPW